MLIKNIIDEDFVNYKKSSMYVAFPFCNFKCEKECGIKCCQNSPLALSPNIDVDIDRLVDRYVKNEITHAIVMAGLEPIDSFDDLLTFIDRIRQKTDDDIIIYTGYTKEECKDLIYLIKEKMKWSNIIMKYGRYVPGQESHYDEVLGVKLANKEQYAEKIS